MNERTYTVPTRNQLAVAACWSWLVAERPALKPGMGCYGLKHVVERWLQAHGPHRYIPMGAVVEALMRWGYALEELGPRVLVCGPPGRKRNAVRGGTARRRTTMAKHSLTQQRTTA